ncbi:hypothetical protein KY290_023284 [Solanum tuberosum]|uniref:Retrotransposon Copia-like N-terminal domain-containing protein n=1 Tax=Solanum tuberosum TaxID=4113 RepID=A0ABQ7V6W5_SOLTU|nr:hypothetical protein KY285_019792 [Solanum tuberosum]KAH0759791.1 hypothetical protein KY290_023284 [Solanum tuberosum]
MTGNNNEAASSPYTMQPTDNPGVFLVTCLLIQDNYSTWRRAMKNSLLAKSKLGFVDGSLQRPTSNSTNEAA